MNPVRNKRVNVSTRFMNKQISNGVNKGGAHWLIFIIIILGSLGVIFGYKIAMKSENKISKDAKINNLGYTGNPMAVMKTNMGEIKLELFAKDAPETVGNFIKLSREKFYDGTRFHRVIKGFMIQGGDPNSKDEDWSNDGIGGPGYAFKDEINSNKIIKGVLAMANAGPGTNGSQFFIVTAESAPWLDGKHTVFGKVVEGMDIVSSIENVATDKAKNDHPVENVTVESMTIVD